MSRLTAIQYLEEMQREQYLLRYGEGFELALRMSHSTAGLELALGMAKAKFGRPSADRDANSAPRTVDEDFQFELLRAVSQNSDRVFDREGDSRYSRYEDPFFARIIEHAWDDIQPFLDGLVEWWSQTDQEFAKEARARLEDMVVGAVDHPELNAMSIRPPDTDDYIVVFNSGLPTFLAHLGRIIVGMAAAVPVAEFARANLEDDKGFKRYRKLLAATLTDLTNSFIIQNTLAALLDYCSKPSEFSYDHEDFFGSERWLSETMICGAELFIIGHECAHALLGHLDCDEEPTRLAFGLEASIYTPKQEDEIDADDFGIAAMLATAVSKAKREPDENTGSKIYAYYMRIPTMPPRNSEMMPPGIPT